MTVLVAVARAMPLVLRIAAFLGATAVIASAVYTAVRILRRAEEPLASAVGMASYAIPVGVYGLLAVFLVRELVTTIREVREVVKRGE